MYRVVVMYQDQEIAEGFGESEASAEADAMEQVSEMYEGLDLTTQAYQD